MIPESIPIYFDGFGLRAVRGFRYDIDPGAEVVDTDKDNFVSVAEMGRYLLQKDPNLTSRNLTASIRSEFMQRLYKNMPKEDEKMAMRIIIPLSIAGAGGAIGGMVGFFAGTPTGPGVIVSTAKGAGWGFSLTASVVGALLAGFNILESSRYADDSQLVQETFVF